MCFLKCSSQKMMHIASVASVITAGALLVLKLATFLVTGSVAILSSLFDSVQDGMTSVVNFIAVRQANMPADTEHRFGHGKAQALGGLIQAFIIAVAAIFLTEEAVTRLMEPAPIAAPLSGIVVTVIAIVATVVLVAFQTTVIRKTGSLSIKADRAHYTGDIGMNIGVIVSILASYYLGWTCVDALFGIGVGLYLFCVVYHVGKESFAMLMDTELPAPCRKQIQSVVLGFPAVYGIEHLKTRLSGNQPFIQFCVRLDANMTLKQAHDMIDEIETALRQVLPQAEMMIHPEPNLSDKRICK